MAYAQLKLRAGHHGSHGSPICQLVLRLQSAFVVAAGNL